MASDTLIFIQSQAAEHPGGVLRTLLARYGFTLVNPSVLAPLCAGVKNPAGVAEFEMFLEKSMPLSLTAGWPYTPLPTQSLAIEMQFNHAECVIGAFGLGSSCEYLQWL